MKVLRDTGIYLKCQQTKRQSKGTEPVILAERNGFLH